MSTPKVTLDVDLHRVTKLDTQAVRVFAEALTIYVVRTEGGKRIIHTFIASTDVAAVDLVPRRSGESAGILG